MRTPGLFLVLLTAANLLAQDTTPPAIQRLTPVDGSTVVRLFEVEVLFDEEVQGVDAADLLINGVAATGFSAGSPGQYRFTFPQPATGPVHVEFALGHGITDTNEPPNAFVGAAWNYTLNPALAINQVRINEFMADNQTGIRDQDGTFQDWIELYNGSPIPVELGGCFLTDRKDLLTQWPFPPFMLPPNTYLIVWASNKDRTNVAQLHTNFRLNNDGEYLALVVTNASGTNVVSAFDPVYPAQRVDTSYGRDPLDPNIVGYYPGTNASPGRINSTSGGSEFAPDVVFSREGGTFLDPFDLVLSTPSPTAVIRYVLVTSLTPATATITNVPTTNSPMYTGPIRIDQTTQVRVRTFEPGKLPGTPISVTYLHIGPSVVNFSSDLPLIVIHNFNNGTLEDIQTDRTVAIASFHSDLDRSSLTNRPDLMTRGAANDRGSSTASQVKVNMAVEFWDEFNQDADRPLLGMPAESDWVLYGINGFDPGMMHNAIFHWFGRGIGRYSSRTRYCEVFLKTTAGPITTNDYWGVYLLEEKPKRNNDRVDIESLQPENTNAPSVTGGYLLRIDRLDADERTFSTPTISITNLFVNGVPVVNRYGDGPNNPTIIVDYPISLQWGTDPRRAAQRFYIADYFTNFMRALTSPNFTDPELGYARYVDVDSWIENHIANIICFNVDGYRLSGYMFKDRDKKIEQGPPWDCDRCLGTGGAGGATPQGDGRCFNPRQFRIVVTGFPGTDPDQGTDFFGTALTTGVDMWDRMFRDPNFWQRWIDRYQQFRTNQFSDARVLAMVDDFYQEIKEAQVREQAKWSATFTYPRSGNHNQNGYSYNFGPTDTRFVRGGYFTNEVNFQKQWLLDRMNFLDTNFLAMPVLTNGTSLVPGGTTITVLAASKPGTIIYYTLDGTDPRLPGGGIAPGALSSPGHLSLTVNGNVRLFARCYNTGHFNLTNRYVSATSYEVGKPHLSSHWSGPVAATFYTAVPSLRVTEIMYHPANPTGGDTNDQDGFEYLEVKNIGTESLSVNGFRLSGGLDFVFPNQTLAPGEHAVIVKDVALFQSRYGAGPRILGSYTNNLANDGEQLVLEGSVREPILDFSYNDTWYPITDGPGFSLQIINDMAPTDTWGTNTSWRPSGVGIGTPGAPDPGVTAVAAVYVNEVLSNTDPSPTDAIELYNSTGAEVNIGGWFLTDNFGEPKKYRIPDNTMIGANGYLAFVQNTSFGLGPNGFGLSGRGEDVFVFSADAAGNLTGWYHGFDFGAQANGVTFGRYVLPSTGEDQFPTQTSPSLGVANPGPQVGPIVISEINFHPPDLVYPFTKVDNNLDEYVELHNASGADVPLFDPANPANTWRLRDAVDFIFPTNRVIPAGGYALVVGFDPRDSVALANFKAVNNVPEATPVYGPWSGQLDNAEDSVELARPGLPEPPVGFVPYILVERVRYKDTAPWPSGFADGLGASLGRVNVASYGNDPANWLAAIKTPGAPFITGGTAPQVTTQPVNAVSAETFSASFSIAATGSEPLIYQWLFNGEPLRVASSPTLILNGLKLNQAGEYSCLVFSPGGITVSSNATLTVRTVAVIAQHPASRSVFIKPDPRAANLADGTNVTFTVNATSDFPPIAYQWRFNGVPIPNATNVSLVVTNVQLEDEGEYSVGVVDDVGRTFGAIYSSNARLTPLLQPVVVQAPIGQTIVEGRAFSHSVLVSGNPVPMAFRWTRGSVGLVTNFGHFRSDFVTLNAATSGLTLTNNQPSANYQMRVIITNEATAAALSPGVLVSFTNTVLADFDRDGIPDVAENDLGLATNNAADAALDLDGDGMSNGAEYTAGTDVASAASYLKIEQGIVPNLASVHFAAVSNRTYTVQFTDDLNVGAWSRLADVLARTTNRVETFIDPTWTTNRFYRVALPRQP